MSEELEVLEGASGIDRRSFIKRGAIVGGMVWAAPAISALGPRAFAQENGTPRLCTDISNIAVVFTVNGTTYQAKYDLDDGCAATGNATPNCPDPDGWSTGLDGCSYITWNTTDPCCWEATFNVPGDLEITSVVGVIEGGGPSQVGFCVGNGEFIETNGGTTYRWCSPTRTS
jgi:hypothetical protein